MRKKLQALFLAMALILANIQSVPVFAAGSGDDGASQGTGSVSVTADAGISDDASANSRTDTENASSEDGQAESSADEQEMSAGQSTIKDDSQTDGSKTEEQVDLAAKDITFDLTANSTATVYTVTLTGYTSETGAAEIKCAVWSDTGWQDDLQWVYLSRESDGSYQGTFRPSSFKHYGKFYFDVYDGTVYVGGTTATIAASGLESTMEAEEESTYSWTVTLMDEHDYEDGIRFAVWSDTGWQDDLKWYTATKSESPADVGLYVYTCKVNLKDHKHLGKYYVDAYSGSTYIKSTEFSTAHIKRATVSQTWEDQEKGVWKVIIDGIEDTDLTSKVQVPTWSKSDQSDMIWYDAEKQEDGSWVAEIKASKHGYNTGKYISHVYVTDVFGDKTYVGQTSTEFNSKVEKALEVTPNADGSWYTISLTGYQSDSATVRAAVWSKTGGQDDLLWLTMAKKSDGSYQGSFKPADFKHNGTYYIDVYDGSTFVQSAKAIVSQAEKASLEVTDLTSKGFTVTISGLNSPAGVKELKLAVWSESDGQDDLFWHKAEKQADGTYQVIVSKGDHKRNTGKYLADAYLTDGNGYSSYIGGLTVEVPEAETKSTLEVTKTDQGYHFDTKNIDIDDIESISYAVWSKVDGQDDLYWYDGTYQEADSSSSCDWTMAKHKGFGTYYVHCYAITKNGSKIAVGGTTFDIAAPTTTVTPHTDGSWFLINIDAFDSPYTSQTVEVAVWSTQSQSNLKWYTATRKSDGSYYVNSHTGQHQGLPGTYSAHVYLVGPNGDRTCIGTTSFSIGVSCSMKDFQCDNGSMKLTASFTSNDKVTAVYFPVWSDADGQDDILWYQAEKQADGQWVAWVNIGKHNYVTGLYHAHCYADYGTNGRTYMGQTSFTVDDTVSFYTVVNSSTTATGVVQGYANASSVTVKLWSNNGGNDDLMEYRAVKDGNLWKATFLKANHGSAGFYTAELYIDGSYVATDTFSFDDYRTQETFHSISTAHAAGAAGPNNDAVYTNCVQALNESYQEGFRTMELDVILTSDGQAVMYHTWNTGILDNYTYSSSTSSGPTYSSFINDTMYNGAYDTSDYADILTYLADHPDVRILMDTKYTTEVGVRTVYNTMTQVAANLGLVSVMKQQIVPYFFNANMYNWISSSFSFDEYHYATYALGWNPFTKAKFQEICEFCKSKKVTTLSMWDSLAEDWVLRMADSYGLCVYVHTTDDVNVAAEKLNNGAAGLISNVITPSAAQALIG